MGAITWRQLVAPDDSGAFKALHTANEAFNSGFDAFNKAIASRQTANQYQEDLGRKTSVANYLDAVQQAGTPEAAAALQADPRMQALGAAVDPRDRDLVRNAIEARLASTRQNVTAGQTFQDTQTAWNSRDAVNAAFDKAVASKDPAQIQGFMESIPANHPARVELGAKLLNLVQGNAKTASDLDTAGAQRTHWANTDTNASAQTRVAERNAATNELQAKTQQQQVNQQAVHNLETLRSSAIAKLADVNKNIVGSNEGEKVLTDAVKAVAGDRAPNVLRFTGEALASDPKYRKLPTDVVVAIVQKHSADWGTGNWAPDMNNAGRIKADLEAAFSNPEVLKQMTVHEASVLTAGNQLKALGGVSDIAMNRAFPEWAAGMDAALARKQESAATAGSPSSVTVPVAPPKIDAPVPTKTSGDDSAIKLQTQLEQKLIALGALDKHSPEVQKALNASGAAGKAESDARLKAGAKWYQEQAIAQARNATNPMNGSSMPPDVRAKEVQALKDQLKELTKKGGVTPPTSVPATQTGTTGSQAQDGTAKIGAFDAPKAIPTAGGPVVAAGRSPATPQTDHLAINTGTGDTQKSSKPVEIPKDVQWQKPVTAIRASGLNKTGATGKAVITYVPDGDTAYGKDGLKCRIDGVDAPETAHEGKKGQAYGEEAGKVLQNMVLNKEVTIRITKPTNIQPGEQPSKTNNYGRDVCQIEVEGKDVSTELLKAGAAWLYSRFNNDPRLQAVQEDAQKNKRGLWADKNPIPPNQFRNLQNY